MTALQGTFELMGFSEVASLLATKAETGRLHVRARAVGADLYLSDGSFTGITLADEPAPASARAARQRLEEVCFDFLSAERGTFEFHPGQSGRPAATLSVKVETVLAGARRRADEWREIREAIPSLDIHPLMAEELNATEITLDRRRWEVLAALDGRRTVHALARKLKLSEFDTCRVLKSLMDDGAVALPEMEQRRAVRAAEQPVGEPRPPLRISSKKPRAGADGAGGGGKAAANGKSEGSAATAATAAARAKDGSGAGAGAAGAAAAASAADDDGNGDDQKRSRLPTVGRLRRGRQSEA